MWRPMFNQAAAIAARSPRPLTQCLHLNAAPSQMAKGEIAVRQPVKILMEKGKHYKWCACGLSKKQPFCDGSHSRSPKGITPISFSPDATKEYTLCQCKQSNQRPFCDGTHSKVK